MKILIATDDSKHSRDAVKEFAARPLPSDTEVRIVSVYADTTSINTEPMGALRQYYREVEEKALKAARQAAEHAAKILRKNHSTLSVVAKAIEGEPKTAILNEAEAFGADLIVVGSHGYGVVKRFLLGSVAQAVALNAKCSVEIVRKSKQTSSK